MEFQCTERNPPTPEYMQSVVVSVEVNLLPKRARVRNERRGSTKYEPPLSEIKIDSLVKGMEKFMGRIENIERKPL